MLLLPSVVCSGGPWHVAGDSGTQHRLAFRTVSPRSGAFAGWRILASHGLCTFEMLCVRLRRILRLKERESYAAEGDGQHPGCGGPISGQGGPGPHTPRSLQVDRFGRATPQSTSRSIYFIFTHFFRFFGQLVPAFWVPVDLQSFQVLLEDARAGPIEFMNCFSRFLQYFLV